jgi:hypothetical protein
MHPNIFLNYCITSPQFWIPVREEECADCSTASDDRCPHKQVLCHLAEATYWSSADSELLLPHSQLNWYITSSTQTERCKAYPIEEKI